MNVPEKAIVLVAGRGERLRPLTDTLPKCLIKVNGKSILERMLENLEKVGIKETILVVGYLADMIREKIGNSFSSMKITYMVSDVYDKTNNSYSLWIGIRDLDENLLILEGDVVFEQKLLANFLAGGSKDATLVEKWNPNLDGTFIDVNDGIVKAWVHKKDRPQGFTIKDKYKTVNIHKLSREFLNSWLKPELRRHIEETGGLEPIETIFKCIVTKGVTISASETAGKWFEIDDVKELKIAEEMFKEKISIDEVRSKHGGYWRYSHLDFHYLFNHYFPTKELYADLQKRLPKIGNYYPSSQKVLAELLAKWKDEEYFNADNLVVGNGSSELIRMLNDHVITKAKVVLPTFNEFVRVSSEKIHKYILDEKNRFKLDVDKLIEEVKKSNTEFAVIVNPNNPIGSLVPLKDIENILRTGVVLIIDEAFMTFAGSEHSAEQLVPKYKNLVVVTSCTKSIGIAGLRLGYVLTSNEEIKKKLREHIPIWNVNSVTEHLIEVFPKYKKEHKESIEKSVADTKWFFECLRDIPYLDPYPTHANAIFCKVAGSARKLAEVLYYKYDFMVKEGLNQKDFKTDSYVRIGVRNREDNEKLLAALKEIKTEELQ